MMNEVPADDRGFTLGDGLFETVRAMDGEFAWWEEHMARLGRGCDVLGLPRPSVDACRSAAQDALSAAGAPERAAVRLSWSAGSGARGLTRDAPVRPRLVATAAPSPPTDTPARLRTSGVRRNESSPASRLKTLAYLDNVLARREAVEAGADEALMLNTRGELACAAAANLFWIRGRTLLTPALECGVLDGIVRAAILLRAPSAGWAVQEVRAGPEALEAADAVFLTSSLIGLRPVGRLDGRDLEPHPALAVLSALTAP